MGRKRWVRFWGVRTEEGENTGDHLSKTSALNRSLEKEGSGRTKGENKEKNRGGQGPRVKPGPTENPDKRAAFYHGTEGKGRSRLEAAEKKTAESVYKKKGILFTLKVSNGAVQKTVYSTSPDGEQCKK